ncbi:hypothetical protein [Mycobacteroides chelonae]|uniref:hypothetical protein n=1 Tax=Mycobacteroides chelonae TaxID=1774 RepID=UPI001C2C57FE|nr:hypothetical protein [Mycobacteroides chelonae]
MGGVVLCRPKKSTGLRPANSWSSMPRAGRINERELERAIYRAAYGADLSQRRISDIVGTYSQATVQRILRRIAADPSLLNQTPTEIIDRRAAGLAEAAFKFPVTLAD